MATTQPQTDRIDPAVWRVTAVVLVGGLAAVFDSTIVSVALKSLATGLDTDLATIQWVTTGYLLALGVAVPLAGWAQRRIGGKRLWLIALTLFLVGSLACAASTTAGLLIASRVLQGLGGGLMLPLMQTLVLQAAGGKALGKTVALVSLPIVLGPILGPLIGGAVLKSLDWHWLFLVNVPLCVIGFALAAWLLPRDAGTARVPLDGVGLALIAPGLVGALYGLSNAHQSGGFTRADVLWPLAAGVALVALFAWRGWRRGTRPSLIDVRLLGRGTVASAAMLMFLTGAALYGAMLLLPLYWQVVRGTDALTAGIMLIPQGLGNLSTRSIAGSLTDRIGPRAVAMAGMVLVAIGTVPYAMAGATTNGWLLAAALVVRGAGLGAVFIPLMTVAYRGLPAASVPDASIITRISQQLGGAFGTALLAVVLSQAVADAHTTAELASGFGEALWWATGCTAAGALLCALLPGRPALDE